MAKDNKNEQESTTRLKTQRMGFEQWRALYLEDPQKFEQNRQQVLNDFIDSAPEKYQARLKGLKFQMECEARRLKSDEAYHMRLFTMMMESLASLNDQFQELLQTVNSDHIPEQDQKDATVLPMVKPD